MPRLTAVSGIKGQMVTLEFRSRRAPEASESTLFNRRRHRGGDHAQSLPLDLAKHFGASGLEADASGNRPSGFQVDHFPSGSPKIAAPEPPVTHGGLTRAGSRVGEPDIWEPV